MDEMPEQEEIIFNPDVLVQRRFYELTLEDLKIYRFTLMEYVKVRKLISTGRITRVNDKTVFKFLKISVVHFYSTNISKHQSNKERP
jgi:hypothetical protein